MKPIKEYVEDAADIMVEKYLGIVCGVTLLTAIIYPPLGCVIAGIFMVVNTVELIKNKIVEKKIEEKKIDNHSFSDSELQPMLAGESILGICNNLTMFLGFGKITQEQYNKFFPPPEEIIRAMEQQKEEINNTIEEIKKEQLIKKLAGLEKI